eukprot:6920393-Prymnesium_polylepis.1
MKSYSPPRSGTRTFIGLSLDFIGRDWTANISKAHQYEGANESQIGSPPTCPELLLLPCNTKARPSLAGAQPAHLRINDHPT